MIDLKNEIINEIIRVEGGYVNDESDSGGETNFGITKATALTYGFAGAMIDLPVETAFEIYSDRYWNSLVADSILNISSDVAKEVVDTAINMGVGRAGTFLQRSLNVLNKKQTLYRDIAVDGKIGVGTLTALRLYVGKRDAETLVKMLNCLQGAKYVALAERREKDEKFVYGWFKNRVTI